MEPVRILVSEKSKRSKSLRWKRTTRKKAGVIEFKTRENVRKEDIVKNVTYLRAVT